MVQEIHSMYSVCKRFAENVETTRISEGTRPPDNHAKFAVCCSETYSIAHTTNVYGSFQQEWE